MFNAKLICFSGIDCTGKSTQIKLLEQHLIKSGHKCTVFWYRPGYSTFLDRLRFLVRKANPDLLPSASSKSRTAVFQRPGVSESWLAMALTDALLQYGMGIRAQLALGRTVLCDRYIHDARIDLILRFPKLQDIIETIFPFLVFMCPKPDISYFFDLPFDKVLRRTAEKKEPFPDSPETMKKRHEKYVLLFKQHAFHNINAALSIQDIHNLISEQITELMEAQ